MFILAEAEFAIVACKTNKAFQRFAVFLLLFIIAQQRIELSLAFPQ
jgi:hypothetical protein